MSSTYKQDYQKSLNDREKFCTHKTRSGKILRKTLREIADGEEVLEGLLISQERLKN